MISCGDFAYRSGITYTEFFGKDKEWGAVVALQSQLRLAAEHTNSMPNARWRTIDIDGRSITLPIRLVQNVVDIDRQRESVSGTIERRFGNNAYYYLRGTFNRFTEVNNRPLHLMDFNEVRFANPVFDEDGNLLQISNTRLAGRRQSNTRTFEDSFRSLASGAEWYAPNAKTSAQLSYSLAKNTQGQRPRRVCHSTI
ncbi:MAG: hypothetical protein LR015_03620 [Verrucomicrobia bacterium]|nr:hypothetical protein [Verrucomicrobiota bacterium]